jgi:4-amino-4-deoxy-L-arabinose transferase-like glycosyltransferase
MSNVQVVPTPVKQPRVAAAAGGARPELLVLLVAAAVYLLNIVSPPSLLDDVDAWQALMAKNMLRTGDWVTARVDGVVYFEKAPLKYWITALFYKAFGIHDWVARIPIALFAIGLAFLLVRMAKWAFDDNRVPLYAGIVISTCVGLFLFTRFIIPDVLLTLTCSLALYGFIHAIEPDEQHSRWWAYLTASACAAGVLTKGLIGVVIPAGAIFFYLLATRQLLRASVWKRLYPLTGAFIFLLLAAPWHVLASLRNPPVLDFTMHSGPGQYHGFFWFYFINEQVLRFLNLRYPRDYNTVPRLAFWGFHLLWLFPWSAYLPSVFKLDYRPGTRAGRLRLLCACWIGFVLLFFTFSTTQEYYSMPIYPALALLLACGMARNEKWVKVGNWILTAIAMAALATIAGLLVVTAHVPTPGDISVALARHPSDYTLSLGHMLDLTVESFAYLRLPLAIAGIAFLIGAVGAFILRGRRAIFAFTGMMVVFYFAARLAMVTFDPYMSSRPIAEALNRAPAGQLIIQDDINRESSVLFYHTDHVLVYNGRYFVLEYGSYAPNAPQVFIGDNDLKRLWSEPQRYYLLVPNESLEKIRQLIPAEYTLASIGGKTVVTNEPLH